MQAERISAASVTVVIENSVRIVLESRGLLVDLVRLLPDVVPLQFRDWAAGEQPDRLLRVAS